MASPFPPPQEPKPPSGRTRHPFFMHAMVRGQQVAVQATLAEAAAFDALPKLRDPKTRLLTTGIGTSFHAAIAVAAAARAAAPGRVAEARTAFDLLDAPETANADLAVAFSESAETYVTVRALELLRTRNVPTLLITAAPSGEGREMAGTVFETKYSREDSWTHTVSYAAAVAAGWSLVQPQPDPVVDATVVAAIGDTLDLEPKVLETVEAIGDRDRFVLVGSGSAEATAREAALKIREATGRFATSVGVEELLHGILPSVTERTAVLAISGTPLERQRADEGLAAARHLDAFAWLIDTSGAPTVEDGLALPPVPPSIAPIVQGIPFQWLAYWIAVQDGRNPDIMGLDDPKVLAARRSFGI
ncbi:MAG: SIS domain-containing protein [Thermoplasmata archaeon]|nr:SIS domain-containing protein [Thermoplasmata archaeon]